MLERTARLALLLPALAAAACKESPAEPEPSDIDLMKQATEAYQTIDAAVAAGFVPLSECVASPAGGMGMHYGLPARIQDAIVDASQPEVLLFAPTANGGAELVAVEFMMHKDVWSAAGNTDSPSVAGEDFDPPDPNHPNPDLRPFHTLHAWVWKDNPSGMFAPFNPDVSCD